MTKKERVSLLDCMSDDPTLWRAESWAAYAQVNDELQRVRTRKLRHLPEKALQGEVEIAQDDLDAALYAMAPPKRRGGAGRRVRPRRALTQVWQALKLYYTGARIERTWSAIHRASAALYMLYDESELPAQATRLHELVEALPDLSSQLTSLTGTVTSLEKNSKGPKLKTRAVLREFYREAMGATESLQTEARVLRNTLLVASGALFLIVFVLGTVHLINDSVISLCTANGDEPVCPAGGSSHPFDVFAVELAGMLGGVLSVVIPLATGERVKTPYRIFNHQLLLKIFAGAAAGLAGVVLVESGLIPAFAVTSETAIIGYAVFFGFAQQALTGFIDRRANELEKETPTTKSV